MAVLVTVACPQCSGTFETEYVRLGAGVTCASCGQMVVAEVAKGAAYPMRDYEMTFRSFAQLISFEPYRKEVAPFLRTCGFALFGTDEDTLIERENGTPVEPLEAHLEIQGDPQRQRDIHQVAMSVWR